MLVLSPKTSQIALKGISQYRPTKKGAEPQLLFSCDSDGTQTHDLQNRNLTLYSTELPSHDVAIRTQS